MGFAPELIRSGIAAAPSQPATPRLVRAPELAEEPTF